jgi:hypothetical protein
MKLIKYLLAIIFLQSILAVSFGQKVIVSVGYPVMYIGYKNKIDFAVEGYTKNKCWL